MLSRRLRGDPEQIGLVKSTLEMSDSGGARRPSGIADVRRKAGGSLNKAGTEISSLLFKMVPSQLETRRMIANQIRRLRRHGETTAVERHDPSNVFYRGVEQDREILTELCSKLLDVFVE